MSSEMLVNGFAGCQVSGSSKLSFLNIPRSPPGFPFCGGQVQALKLTVKNRAVALKGLLGNSSQEINLSKNFFEMPFVGLLQFLIL